MRVLLYHQKFGKIVPIVWVWCCVFINIMEYCLSTRILPSGSHSEQIANLIVVINSSTIFQNIIIVLHPWLIHWERKFKLIATLAVKKDGIFCVTIFGKLDHFVASTRIVPSRSQTEQIANLVDAIELNNNIAEYYCSDASLINPFE